MAIIFVIQSFMCFRIAFGISFHWERYAVAASYAFVYLISQVFKYHLDPVSAGRFSAPLFAPFDAPHSRTPGLPFQKRKEVQQLGNSAGFGAGSLDSLFKLKTSIVYMWTNVCKMHPLWFAGEVLKTV